jgi:hypothetical protein
MTIGPIGVSARRTTNSTVGADPWYFLAKIAATTPSFNKHALFIGVFGTPCGDIVKFIIKTIECQ